MPFSLIIKDVGENREIHWAQVFVNKMCVLDPLSVLSARLTFKFPRPVVLYGRAEPSGTKADWFLSIALNKCGKIRNKCKLFLVAVLLVCRKEKPQKNKVSFSSILLRI